MNRPLWLNTFKISVAAILAVVIAEALRLDYAISAGIVAILSIQPTKKETVRTALSRAAAFLAALAVAYVCFHLAGFGLRGFFLFLCLYIFICQYFGWFSSMAMNSVIISHFTVFQDMQMIHIGNEVMIFLIGVMAGVIANLHLRKNTPYIAKLTHDADSLIREILRRMAAHIMQDDKTHYNEAYFARLSDTIREAENTAKLNADNQILRHDLYDLQYIAMRRQQQEILKEMYKLVRTMHSKPITTAKISSFLMKIADEYHRENTVETLLETFYALSLQMKQTPLPTQRNEFEDRAKLFILLKKIEEFLQIKREFMDQQSRNHMDSNTAAN